MTSLCAFAPARVLVARISLCIVVAALVACGSKKKGTELEHQKVGALEVAVLALEKKKSARVPGVKVEPAPGQQFVRVSLHAKGGGAEEPLNESELTLVGAAGTKAKAEEGWGSKQLTNSFRILEYWFSMPTAEEVASLQLKGQTIPLQGFKSAWPFRVAIERVSLVDKLKISGPGVAEREVPAMNGEQFILVDLSFESLLPPPAALPPADEQRGDLRIYVEKPSPDVAMRLATVQVVGSDDLEFAPGAVAAAGQDQFFVAKNMTSVSVVSDKPKTRCRIALRSHQLQVPKLKQLQFGPLSVNLPALPATTTVTPAAESRKAFDPQP